MVKTLISGPVSDSKNFLSSVLPLLFKYCSKLSSYTISKKTNEPNLRKRQKKLISSPILALLAHILAHNSFFVGCISTSS